MQEGNFEVNPTFFTCVWFFWSLNNLDISLLFCRKINKKWNPTTLRPQSSNKNSPPFSQQLPSKNWGTVKPSPFLKFGMRFNPPSKKGVHTMWHKIGDFITTLHLGVLISPDLKLSNLWKSSWGILTIRCFWFVVKVLEVPPVRAGIFEKETAPSLVFFSIFD